MKISKLYTPNCYTRGCKHFLGVSQSDGTEATEYVYCLAYPKGIPNDIAYGDAQHLKVREDQNNDIVFEEK
jgi:hypothetical protein